MRTTLTIDDDVLLAAKALARRQKRTVGAAISDLARQALNAGPQHREEATSPDTLGFVAFPAGDKVVTEALIDELREAEGV